MRTIAAIFILVLLFLSGLIGSAGAVLPGEALDDPALEARARAISAELRCLVCQNQSIDDSDAELARDLRVLVRERIAAGDSDKEVYAFVVARYGEFVLLKPPFSLQNALLWAAPLIFLLLGGFAIYRIFESRAPAATPSTGLNEKEHAALEKILREDKLDP